MGQQGESTVLHGSGDATVTNRYNPPQNANDERIRDAGKRIIALLFLLHSHLRFQIKTIKQLKAQQVRKVRLLLNFFNWDLDMNKR